MQLFCATLISNLSVSIRNSAFAGDGVLTAAMLDRVIHHSYYHQLDWRQLQT
jgi:hypothetical protein